MQLFYYLLEANIYLTLAYLFYLVLLKRHTFFQQHRFYLLITSAFSFAIPLISGMSITKPNVASAERIEFIQPIISPPLTQASAEAVWFDSLYLIDIFILLYWCVVFISLTVLIKSVIQICLLYNRSEKTQRQGLVIAVLPQQKTIFSFRGWLFSHSSFIENEIILEHEKVHIREKHSLDILWFELLKAFNWFNPVSYHLLKSAKLNHEFIADSRLSEKYDPFQYAMLLINHAHDPSLHIAHAAFTATQMEKRMGRMTSERSGNRSRFLLVLFVPLVLPLVYLSIFSIDKNYALLRFSSETQDAAVVANQLEGEAVTDKLIVKLSEPDPVTDTSGPRKPRKKLSAGKNNSRVISVKILSDTTSIRSEDNLSSRPSVSEKDEAYFKSRYANPDTLIRKNSISVYNRYASLAHTASAINYKEELKPVSVYPKGSGIKSTINPDEKYSVSLFESTKRPSAFQ